MAGNPASPVFCPISVRGLQFTPSVDVLMKRPFGACDAEFAVYATISFPLESTAMFICDAKKSGGQLATVHGGCSWLVSMNCVVHVAPPSADLTTASCTGPVDFWFSALSEK